MTEFIVLFTDCSGLEPHLQYLRDMFQPFFVGCCLRDHANIGLFYPCVNYYLTLFYQAFTAHFVPGTMPSFRRWSALFLRSFFHPVKIRWQRTIYTPFWESRSLWAPRSLFVHCRQWNRCFLVLTLMILSTQFLSSLSTQFLSFLLFLSSLDLPPAFLGFSTDCPWMAILPVFPWLGEGGQRQMVFHK